MKRSGRFMGGREGTMCAGVGVEKGKNNCRGGRGDGRCPEYVGGQRGSQSVRCPAGQQIRKKIARKKKCGSGPKKAEGAVGWLTCHSLLLVVHRPVGVPSLRPLLYLFPSTSTLKNFQDAPTPRNCYFGAQNWRPPAEVQRVRHSPSSLTSLEWFSSHLPGEERYASASLDHCLSERPVISCLRPQAMPSPKGPRGTT